MAAARRLPVLALACLLPGAAAASGETERYCDPAAGNTVLYLDVTTPYDEIDQRALVDGVGRIFAALDGGGRLSIRTIEDAFPKSRRLLEECMPACDSGFFGDIFSSCTEGTLIANKKALGRRIVESIAAVVRDSIELPRSEIVRTLSFSAPEEMRKQTRNTVFIYSDMIENSEFLPGRVFLNHENGELVEMLIEQRLVPDLWEAEVHVFGLGRSGKPGERGALPQAQLRHITEFWTKFFAASGASVDLRQNLTMD